MNIFANDKIRMIKYTTLATSAYSLIILSVLYVHFPIGNVIDLIKVVAHWMLLSISSYMIIGVIASNKYINSILLPIFFIVSSLGSFFSYQFDMTFNEALLESLLETNLHESLDLINIQLVLYITFVLLVVVWLVKKRFKNESNSFDILFIISLLISFFVFERVNSIKNNTLLQKVPFSYYTAYKGYVANRVQLDIVRDDISDGSIVNSDSLIVIVVIGEAQRSDHVGVNGYFRNTMPLLESREVVFLPNIYSEWTHTNRSVPLILTRADSSDYSISYKEKSFISIFNKCDFSTSWLGNQIPGTTYKPLLEESDFIFINRPELSVYSNSKKLDTDLLPVLKERLAENEPNKLIVIHQIGSHWWYNSHYPDSLEFYNPVLKGKSFNETYKEEYINSYDNTIRFTDVFIDKIISEIEDDNSILIYLSDHGESMGENGKWLHANGVDEERNPACFVWSSEKYLEKNNDKVQKLILNKDRRYRTDFMFHSVLDASNLSSKFLVEDLSIFR